MGSVGLHELFGAADASAGAQRLLSAIDDLPLRYAPFYGRIATLWDTSEEAVIGVLEQAKDPRAWYNPGLWGLQLIDVQGGPRTAGADLHLVKFKAGMRFPHHRHPGPEALLVLEGNYTDSDGRFVGPGDIHEMAPGTDHAFQVGSAGPCIAASLQSGREFTGLFMRLLAKIAGR
jgi:anti-sigma factor ChrR (cupin superfamily)